MTTRKEVGAFYNCDIKYVEAVESKQLFVVELPRRTVLVSYLTIVGRFNQLLNVWELTDYKYSRTTSAQLNYFKKLHPDFIGVEGEIL